MITTENIKIPYTNDNTVIEQRLYDMGIDPLRWAIVSVDEENLTLTVSFEKKGNF